MIRAITGNARGLAILATLTLLAGPATAGPLNPLDFPLSGTGAFPTAPGSYTFDTSGTPSLTGPGLAAPILGTVSATGVAVFDFTSIAVASGQTFLGMGPLPLALLSRGDVTIGGTIDVSAPDGLPGPGGSIRGGPGAGGPGAFASFISPVGPPTRFFLTGGGGGGGFGGGGGNGGAASTDLSPVTAAGGTGGRTYGDLSLLLQGGSGGGDSSSGGGGGALELGAVGNINISVTGKILASGGDAAVLSPEASGGGGGSGGGIFLHGSGVVLSGGLGAVGGRGSPGGADGRGFPFQVFIDGPGGGGGGGRVLIQAGPGGFTNLGTIDVSGGVGSTSGGVGVVTINVVPEPASLVLLATGLMAPIGARWLHPRLGRAPGRSAPGRIHSGARAPSSER